MILIAVLFLIPAYYLAKSKGYNATTVLIAAGILSIGVPAIARCYKDLELLPIIDISFPALALLIVWLLPEKAGAPGKKYLKISFICPECKKDVVFERRYEGKAELCPKCGEIITVPLDEFSPPKLTVDRIKPDATSGQVCFATFGNELPAIQLQLLLNDHGIDAEMISGTNQGMLPQLGGSQGFKIMIDVADWETAEKIEKADNRQINLTSHVNEDTIAIDHCNGSRNPLTKRPKRLLVAIIFFFLAGGLNLVISLLYMTIIQDKLSEHSVGYMTGVWLRIVTPQVLLIVGALGLSLRHVWGRRISLAGLMLGLWPNAQDFYRGFVKAGSGHGAILITTVLFTLWMALWIWCLYSKRSTEFLTNKSFV
jgi:hypothetical protein